MRGQNKVARKSYYWFKMDELYYYYIICGTVTRSNYNYNDHRSHNLNDNTDDWSIDLLLIKQACVNTKVTKVHYITT